MNRTARQFIQRATRGPWPSMQDEAKAILSPRPRTERERASRAAKVKKQQGRREKVAAIRSEVMERAGGRCEWCLSVGPLEWHHIIGAGLRRHRESPQTTTAICPHCHRDWERANVPTLIMADAWAEERGFSEARTAIAHRLTKVREARASREKETRRE